MAREGRYVQERSADNARGDEGIRCTKAACASSGSPNWIGPDPGGQRRRADARRRPPRWRPGTQGADGVDQWPTIARGRGTGRARRQFGRAARRTGKLVLAGRTAVARRALWTLKNGQARRPTLAASQRSSSAHAATYRNRPARRGDALNLKRWASLPVLFSSVTPECRAYRPPALKGCGQSEPGCRPGVLTRPAGSRGPAPRRRGRSAGRCGSSDLAVRDDREQSSAIACVASRVAMLREQRRPGDVQRPLAPACPPNGGTTPEWRRCRSSPSGRRAQVGRATVPGVLADRVVGDLDARAAGDLL